MVKKEVFGYDAGYDFIKAVAGEDQDKWISFPSVYTHPGTTNISKFKQFSQEKFNKDNILIEYQGEKYYIGDIVKNKLFGNEGNRDLKDDKYRLPSEKAKFFATIALLFDEEEITINNLVLGLPIEIYNNHVDNCKSNFEYKNFNFRYDNKSVVLHIERVFVIPQSLGAYFHNIFNFKGEQLVSNNNNVYGIVDIGGRTTDGSIVTNQEIVPDQDWGINSGVFTECYQTLSREIGVPANKIQNQYLQNNYPFKYDNEVHNIERPLKRKFNTLAEKIESSIRK
ncbi:MAG: hypothetical protein ACOCRX_06920, partial [Candidatus Woesearchaeota archaeon]